MNLNCSTHDSIPFGAIGIIVSINDNLFEVIFDEPFIGGCNLGGRCSYLRGGVVEFTDVFNLDRWYYCL